MFSLQFGVPISHISRQVGQKDFYNFTHILASDKSNLDNLIGVRPHDSTAEVKLWGSYLNGAPIADPYYGSIVRWHEVLCHNRKTELLCRMDLKTYITNAFNYPMLSWIR
jgi:protein-tyrosine-phosphatase